MSKVMNALKQSQQHYGQSRSVMPSGYREPESSSHPARRWLHVALWLIPGLATVGVMIYQRVIQAEQEWVMQQTQPKIVQVDAPLERLTYPEWYELLPTFSEPVVDELVALDEGAEPTELVEETIDSSDSDSTQPSTQKQGVEPALGNVDLSQLSPELVQRVQAIMRDQSAVNGPAATAPSSSSVIALTQNSERYQGRLPALNFQMHAFSSNEQKRWIKVNGVEHREGDMLTPEVQLESIKPQSSVILFAGEQIEIPALHHWQG